MSVVVSVEQKMICSFSFLCAYLCLSLFELHFTTAHYEVQQKPENWASICQHLTAWLSLPTALLYTERERDGVKESGGRVLLVNLDSVCVFVF